ncbi:unannotated protein [freshwater metagenome]|uniref:Unannotated protein n=1 Tax=freshwater metagenome TaxID=449393 RepID=A0A6J7JDJ0_9ZZZZ
MPDAAVAHQAVDVVAGALDEVAVVRDDHERPGPRVEQVLERREGVDVEVVGRLVQDEHVGLLHQEAHELQPAALAAGQVLDQRAGAGAAEAEALAELSGGQLEAVAGGRAAADLLEGLEHAQVAGDLDGVLRQLRQPDGRAALDLARRRHRRAAEDVDERRLAGAVDADERVAVARAEAPGGVVEQDLVAVGHRDVLDVDDLAAEAAGGEAQQLDAVARRGLVRDQLVGGVDPELRLRRPGGRTPPQPRELLAQELPAPCVLGGLLAVALRTRQHVGRVAALVLVDGAVDDLPRGGADGVEEPPVVGDDDHRAAPLREEPGEPGHALDVEVVRRLVEQQQVGGVQQQLRQGDAAALAARERPDDGVEALGEAPQLDAAEQALQDGAERLVARPLVVGAVPDQLLADRLLGVQGVALADERQVEVADAGNGAGVGLLEPGDEAHECRLAVAVAPDDADAVAGLDAEGDVGQDAAAGVALVDRLEVDEVLRGGSHRRGILPGRRVRPPPGRVRATAPPHADRRPTASGSPLGPLRATAVLGRRVGPVGHRGPRRRAQPGAAPVATGRAGSRL